MWSHQELKHLQPATYSRRTSVYVDREFQERTSRSILWLAALTSAFFIGPAFYFTNQNYSLFIDLADTINPRLSGYLMRERISLYVIFCVALAAQMVFWYFFTRRLTEKIAAPTKILRSHMRLVSRGDFTVPLIQTRENDEFKELTNSYNYFYRLLQTQYANELDQLKVIKAANLNSAAAKIVDQWIEDRAWRLNRPEDRVYKTMNPLHGEEREKLHDSHRAS